MKFNVSLKQFQDILKKAEYAVAKKSSLPILRSILLTAADNNKLTVTSTDLEVSVSLFLDVDTIIAGQTIIDLDTIKIIKKLKEDYITVTNNNVICGKKTLKFNPLDVETYPSIPAEMPEKLFTLGNVKELFKIKYASASEETRPVFNSIVINKNELVTTDTHRLALRKLPFDTQLENAIIPIKTIEVIDKILGNKDNDTFDVWTDKKKIMFSNKDMLITSKLIDGQYVAYKQVIPKDIAGTITVNRSELLEELEFLPSINNEIAIRIKENKIIIVAKNDTNSVIEQIDINNKNNFTLDIGINVNFLIDTLKNYGEKELEFNFVGEKSFSPFTITAGDKLDLILPLRLKNLDGYFEDQAA